MSALESVFLPNALDCPSESPLCYWHFTSLTATSVPQVEMTTRGKGRNKDHLIYSEDTDVDCWGDMPKAIRQLSRKKDFSSQICWTSKPSLQYSSATSSTWIDAQWVPPSPKPSSQSRWNIILSVEHSQDQGTLVGSYFFCMNFMYQWKGNR